MAVSGVKARTPFWRGEIQHKNLWLIDLETGAEWQLTNLAPDFDIRDRSWLEVVLFETAYFTVPTVQAVGSHSYGAILITVQLATMSFYFMGNIWLWFVLLIRLRIGGLVSERPVVVAPP